MADDLLSIVWNKIAALTGGSQEWPIGLGLRPWYLKVGTFLLLEVVGTHMPPWTCCCRLLQGSQELCCSDLCHRPKFSAVKHLRCKTRLYCAPQH